MFWENFKKLCSTVGKSPNAVAKEIGISSGSVTEWKTGRLPRRTTLEKIADYFGVEPYSLFRKESPVDEDEADEPSEPSMFWEKFYNLCTAHQTKPNPVAKELGISSGVVTKWKNGATPNGTTLLKIANYFGVSTDYLLGKENPIDEDEADEPSEPSVFYKKLIELCKQKGVSRSQMADDIGISRSAPQGWAEKGAVPRLGTIKKIADYFGVSVDYFSDEQTGGALLKPPKGAFEAETLSPVERVASDPADFSYRNMPRYNPQGSLQSISDLERLLLSYFRALSLEAQFEVVKSVESAYKKKFTNQE